MLQHLIFFSIILVLAGCSGINSRFSSLKNGSSPLQICQDGNLSEKIYEEGGPQEIEGELPRLTDNVNDLTRFPQILHPYLEGLTIDREELLEVQREFERHYYRPWNYTVAPVCLKDASWPTRVFTGGYGSNLLRVDPSWIKEMVEQSNFLAYSTLNRYAIATKWMNMRVFPTHKPLYKNPSLPGEGYPFDLLQNSSVGFNEPLFLSHFSLDGAWAYIFTNNASGWVPSDGIALLDNDRIKKIREAKKVFIHTDKVPLKDEASRFIAYSRIGMVLPLVRESNTGYTVSVVKDDDHTLEVSVSKEIAALGVRPLSRNALETIGNQMLKNTYGWGGMFEERDCSSMIREMYTPFGIWLPRNSASQSKKGEVISFKGLSNEEKLDLIREKAIPFETILYKQGHVLLYIGMYENNPMVLHNIWGIKTVDKQGQKGRVIVGKTVISTLKFGSEVENFDIDNMLLTKLISMNIFTKAPLPMVLAPKPKSKKIKL